MTRTLFVPALLLAGGVAHAAPALMPMPHELPTRCEPLAHVPASATIPGPAIAAHLSVANCMAEVAMNALTVSSDDASIARLNAAVAPSLALFDNVIALGDPYWVAVAEDAKRDLFLGMVVRERGSIASDELSRREALEPKLRAWENEAARASEAVAEIVRANPALATRDPVFAGIVGRLADDNRARVAHRVR